MMVLVMASLASASMAFHASWEDGEVNPGGNDQVTSLNAAPYPSTQPELISDGEFGWAVKTFNYPANFSATIVDTAAQSGDNSVFVKNSIMRTDVKVTLASNTVYTYKLWYMLDAANDAENDKKFSLRFLFKDQGHNINFAESVLQNITVPEYDVWYSKSITFDTTGYAYAGQQIQMRTMFQVSGLWAGTGTYTSSGGAYIDNITIVPEPATMAILALGGLLLRKKY